MRKNHIRSRTVEQLKDSSARDRGKRKDAEEAVTHIHIYEKEGNRRDAKIASVGGRARFRSSTRKGHSEHIGRQILVNSSTLQNGSSCDFSGGGGRPNIIT